MRKKMVLLVLFLLLFRVVVVAQSGVPLTVKESDENPKVTFPTQLIFPPGSLTRNGTRITVAFPASGGGTVTSVSVTAANGVSGSVATATTTPAITLTLGAITPTTVNGLTISPTTGTFTLTNGKIFSVSNSLTFTGTDSSSVAFGSGGTVTYTANNLSVFAATTSAQLAGVLSDEEGSGGGFVRATAPAIAGGSHTGLTGLGIRSTGSGAFDLTIANSENLSAGRALTITVNDAARTLNLGGNVTTAANFITSGANSLTLTTTGATNVTLPTTGTLATLAGSEALTNKTISGASNTLSNIGNSSLTNSSVTIGSTSVSLGGTAATVSGLTLVAPTLGVASATSITLGTSGKLSGGTNLVEQKNSTDAQTFRVYGSDDGAGNADFIGFDYSGGTANLVVGKTGSGATRPFKFDASDISFRVAGTDRWGIFTDGMLYPGTTNTYNIGSPSFQTNVAHVRTLLSGGFTHATLGTPSNGSITFCSDCTVTSGADNTCAASGTGALAVRLNGVWRCFNAQN